MHTKAKYMAREERRKAERRRMTIIFTLFVLIVFGLGTLLGFVLCSAFKPATADAAESQEVVVVETEVVPKEYTMEVRCGNRVLDSTLQATMINSCEKYGIPFALALAVAEQESKFNPDAISSTRDYGLMQINKINFGWLRDWGIEPLDHKGNIEAGVLMLSQAVKKHGDYGLALMVYNCGDAGAKRLWKKGVYSTKYSRSTMELYEKWDTLIKSA